MRLCTYLDGDSAQSGVILGDSVYPLGESSIKNVILKYDVADLNRIVSDDDEELIDLKDVELTNPYLDPPKIWGIGLNYREHAKDLDENSPDQEPASFMKPTTTIVAPGSPIMLPVQSDRVTGEAELGVIIGKRCKDVSLVQASEVIFGYTTIIDMTAEDILRRNPRFLTRSKSFDTFFSFGPVVVTADEIDDISAVTVRTILNGEIGAENIVANMTFGPLELVSFHSQVMTLEPGDIISTGTPGALKLSHGDQIGCTVEGVGSLYNPVIDKSEV